MVKGLPVFKKHFEKYQDHYVLIGGSACDIQMEAAGLPFRVTKDFDMVLCVEVLGKNFVSAFWKFVEEGGYQQREKSDGKKEFFRFLKPANEAYPAQLELFSRAFDKLPVAKGVHLTPVPVGDEADSLSAILLDDNYYDCLKSGAVVIEGIRVLKPEYLLVFKAKACVDLMERKAKHEAVNAKDIQKHRLDVFRLFQLLSPELEVRLPENVKKDMEDFFQLMMKDLPDLKTIGIKTMSAKEVVAMIVKIYGLNVAIIAEAGKK